MSYLGEASKKHKMVLENDFAIIDISTAFRAEKINFPSTTVKLFSPGEKRLLVLFLYLDCMKNLTVDDFREWSFVVIITTVVIVIECTRNLYRTVFHPRSQTIYVWEFNMQTFLVEIGAQRIIINLLDCNKSLRLWSAGEKKKCKTSSHSDCHEYENRKNSL